MRGFLTQIFAHEVAHALLRHSKKAQDLNDLTYFFGDVLSVFWAGGFRDLKDPEEMGWLYSGAKIQPKPGFRGGCESPGNSRAARL